MQEAKRSETMSFFDLPTLMPRIIPDPRDHAGLNACDPHSIALRKLSFVPRSLDRPEKAGDHRRIGYKSGNYRTARTPPAGLGQKGAKRGAENGFSLNLER